MTPEERQLVEGLFARIRANPPADRDPEAERLIRDLAARDSSAAYALVQMTLVQEHALRLADERIRQLEQAAPPPSSGRSFLGGMLGQRGSVPASGTGTWGNPGGNPGAVAPPPLPRQPAAPPFSGQGFGGQAGAFGGQPAGGGFLRSAMATAAGVAGGALLFQGISSLFASHPSPFGTPPGASTDATAPAAEPAAGPWAQASHQQTDGTQADPGAASDPGYDQASYDPAADDQVSDGQQDYGDDSFDGGDDWSNA